MDAWTCAVLIGVAGAMGGVVNALLTDNGFVMPRREFKILCPGFLSNVLIGAFVAFASWSFYGSGAAIDLADASTRDQISLRFSALAGAFMVGVAGARWLTSEVDKQFLRESVKAAAKVEISARDCDQLVKAPPRQILRELASQANAA